MEEEKILTATAQRCLLLLLVAVVLRFDFSKGRSPGLSDHWPWTMCCHLVAVAAVAWRAVWAIALLLIAAGPACTSALDVDARPAPANSAAVVHSPDGKARFTVLGPELLRLEFSQSASFDDRQSLSFVNRDLPVPAFNH